MHSVFILQGPASGTVQNLMQRNCESLVRVKFTTVIARSEATWQSVILRNARERNDVLFLRRQEKNEKKPT